VNLKQLLMLGLSATSGSLIGTASAQQAKPQYVQVAEIDIDPAQIENYKLAAKEQIETAIRVEPGVLVLYSVSRQDDPTHVTVFEIYRDMDAYKAHLQTDHFKKYKATTEKMVKSLKLILVQAIALGAKPM